MNFYCLLKFYILQVEQGDCIGLMWDFNAKTGKLQYYVETEKSVLDVFELLDDIDLVNFMYDYEQIVKAGASLSRSSTCTAFCHQYSVGTWQLVFRGASGKLGGTNDIYDLWVSPRTANTDNIQAQTVGSGSNMHYKSEMVERWDDYFIDRIKLAVHKDGYERAFFIFNATEADKESWMTESRLLESSYRNYKSYKFNLFTIRSDWDKRAFFINYDYGGCDKDYGWLVVAEGDPCAWSQSYPNPNILFSPSSTNYVNWKAAEPADEITISFDARARCDGGCLNGGICLPNDLCWCVPGWGGRRCETAICSENCNNHGDCIGPNTCKCYGDFHGPRCQYNTDPCTYGYFREVDDKERSIKYLSTLGRDDSGLQEGWFRFVSPAGEEMPLSCDRTFVNKCGTNFPIWLQGSYPKRKDGIVTLNACVSTGTNCCNTSYPVRVKQCDKFLLYYLQPTYKSRHSGYCAGSEIECPQGQSSTNGYTPGCTENAPTLSSAPFLSVIYNPTQNDLHFKCDIPVKENDELALLVDWYADHELLKHQQIDFTPYSAILDWKYLKEHAGKTITCRVRGKITGNPIVTPQLVSNGHYVGVELTTPSVVVTEGLAQQYAEIKLTTPFVCEETPPTIPPWDFDYDYGAQSTTNCACKLVLSMGVPKYQDHAPPRCGNRKEIEQVVITQEPQQICSIEITPENWNKTFKIPIKAKIDMKYDGDRHRLIKLLPISSCKQTLYNNHKPPSIKVTALDRDKTGFCASINDPHFTTFDGFHYNHYYEGEFVLYRHKTMPYEVRVFYLRCYVHASCNCALAVRSEDDVIVIDYCSKKKTVNVWGQFKNITNLPLRIKGYINGQLTTGTRVFSKNDGRQFEIHLPTGTIVKTTVEQYDFGTFLNAFIQASPADYGMTEGLCGTFNGRHDDELTLPNGNIYTGQGNGERQEPHGFSTSWRVDDDDSFYNGLPPRYITNYTNKQETPTNSTSQYIQFCECAVDPFGENRTVLASCGPNEDVETCGGGSVGSLKATDITNLVLGNKQYRRRRRRDATSYETPFEDADNNMFVYDNTFVQKALSFPTPSGKSMIDAETLCREILMNKAYAKQCEQAVMSVSTKYGKPISLLNSTVNMCVQDILLSDSNMWATSTVQAFQEQCLTEAQRDISSWQYKPGSTKQYPPQFTEQICLHDCNDRGSCIDSVCHCKEGFIGSDCSVDANKAPDLLYLPNGGLCDKSKFNCNSVVVYGDDFVNSPLLTCHQQETLVHDSGYNVSATKTTTKANFKHFGEIICELNFQHRHRRSIDNSTKPPPGSSVGILLAVSNNGITIGSKLMVIVYDSRCQNCSAVGTCRLIQNTCLIDTRCYGGGDLNPANSCQRCIPDISGDTWSEKNGCIDRTLLAWLLTISFVALFVAVSVSAQCYLYHKRKRSQKVNDSMFDLTIKTPRHAWIKTSRKIW